MRIVTAKRAAWLLAGWALVNLAAAAALVAVRPVGAKNAQGGSIVEIAAMAVMVGGLGVLGAFVAAKQPRNPIGWLFLSSAATFGYSAFATGYVVRSLAAPGGMPLWRWAAWMAEWTFFFTSWFPTLVIPYVFPTGRALSRRWVIPLAVGLGSVTLMGISTAFGPHILLDLREGIRNPAAVPAIARSIENLPIMPVIWFLPFSSMLFGAASLVVRFRRSVGVERQQLKWIAVSGSFVVSGVVLMLLLQILRFHFPGDNVVMPGLIVVGMGTMPITISIAILRYRLYDVERVITRTMSYLLVTVVLAALYGLVVVAPSVVTNAQQTPDVLVALGTLAVAAAFVPLRRRVQATVDRRFNRSRYDAQRTIERFGLRLREHVDIDELSAELSRVVTEAMQPRGVQVWLTRPTR